MSERRQMKQCWMKYVRKIQKSPLIFLVIEKAFSSMCFNIIFILYIGIYTYLPDSAKSSALWSEVVVSNSYTAENCMDKQNIEILFIHIHLRYL